jgi:hypothetical protein
MWWLPIARTRTHQKGRRPNLSNRIAAPFHAGPGAPAGFCPLADGAMADAGGMPVEAGKINPVQVTVGRIRQSTRKTRRRSNAADAIHTVLDTSFYQKLTCCLVVCSLFFDDVRLAWSDKSADDSYFAFAIFTMCWFIVDLILNCVLEPVTYFRKFHFWMDLVSVFSLLPCTGWSWSAMVGNGAELTLFESLQDSQNTKLMRLIRLVRMVKLHKFMSMQQAKNAKFLAGQSEPSKVGKKMFEMTSQYVILLVMCLNIFLPFFYGGLDVEVNEFQVHGLTDLHHMPQDYNTTGGVSASLFRLSVEEYARRAGPLLYLEICAQGCRSVWPSVSLYQWLAAVKFQPLEEPESAFSLSSDPAGTALL